MFLQISAHHEHSGVVLAEEDLQTVVQGVFEIQLIFYLTGGIYLPGRLTSIVSHSLSASSCASKLNPKLFPVLQCNVSLRPQPSAALIVSQATEGVGREAN